jgi:hypothetical protein
MRGVTPKKWTAEEDLILRTGIMMGMKLVAIGHKLPGRSRDAIRGRKKALGLVQKTGPKVKKVLAQVPEEPVKRPRFVNYDERNADWAKRTCLFCGVTFDSWGVGNRLCHYHRNLSTGID